MWTWNSSSFSSFSSSAWRPFSGARIRVSTSAGAASNGLAESTPIPSRAVAEVRSIGVVGLGAMGAGIAQLAVEAGFDTVGREVTAELGERAKGQIQHFLTRKVEKGQRTQEERDAALGRLSLTTDLADLAECEVVIEAIVEELGVKRELFAELERIVGREAVLATNTSALSVTEIAAATSSPERVVGMHFFNPAPLMPLVEIVRAELTSDSAFEIAYDVGERLGKTPVRCHDTPGFVVNRILIPLLNDCVRVLDEARLTPADLDAAMKHGAGWPMGPCTLVDLVGIDVHVHASEALWEKLREPRMAPPPRLVAMRNAGLLGRKSGRGFYSYD
jgi:3-hydroxybutyryl-CoA dehydrogenase